MSRTIEEIHKNILDRISDEYEKTPGYLVYDLTRAIAIVMWTQEGNLDTAKQKINVDLLKGDELERYVYQHTGLTRKASSYAIGELQVTGTGTIKINDLFETQNGVQFKAKVEVTIANSGNVPIRAVVAGNRGIVGTNTITLMPVSIPGIVAVNNKEPTYDGYEVETDDSLRNRYYIKLQTPATSGNKYHYKQWALDIVGVGGAKVFPLWNGDNTVQVLIIDSEMKPANSALIERVQEYVDPNSSGKGEGQAPMGAYCTVTSAEGLSINISAKLTLENGANKEIVEESAKNSINKYLESIAFELAAVSYAKIGDAILDTAGVNDYENLLVNEEISNISVGEKQVAILGTVVWSYA